MTTAENDMNIVFLNLSPTRLIKFFLFSIFIFAIFVTNEAKAQVHGQKIDFDERVEQIGYAKHEILERNEKWVFVRALEYPKGNSWSYFFVHNVDLGETILEVDGVYDSPGNRGIRYRGLLLDRVRSSQSVKQIVCPNGRCYGTASIGHYFLAFKSEGLRNPHSAQTGEVAPVSSVHRDADRDGVIDAGTFRWRGRSGSVPTRLSRICMAEGFLSPEQSVEEIVSECGGGTNDLLSRGIGYSRLIYDKDGVRIYFADVARHPGGEVYSYSSDNIVVVSDAASNEPLITASLIEHLFNGVEGEGTEFADRTALNVSVYSSNFRHPGFLIENDPNSEIKPDRVEKPFARAHTQWLSDTGLNLRDKRQREFFLRSNKTIAEVIESRNRSIESARVRERSKRPVLSLAEQRDLYDENAARLAKKYGYLYFSPEYFGIDDDDPPHSFILGEYLNGEFSVGIHHRNRPDFRNLLQSYVYTFSDLCASTNPKGVYPFPVTVTTTKTTYDQDGNQIGEPRIADEVDLLVHEDIYSTWKIIFNIEESSQGDMQRIAQGMEVIRQFFSNPSMIERDPLGFIKEPQRAIQWLISREGCESPALVQLRKNMIRAASGRPSISFSRRTFDDQKGKGPAGSGEGDVLYENYISGLGRVQYVFGSTPMRWNTNMAMFEKRALQHYGQAQNHHQYGNVPLMLTVQDAHPAYGSLQAAHTAVLGLFASEIKPLDDIGRKLHKSVHPRSLSRDSTKQRQIRLHFDAFKDANQNQMVVVCEYSDGESLIYWKDQVPSGSSPAYWKAQHPNHPLADFRSPRNNCPAHSSDL